jgi:sulfite exporter TauE/SafE
MITALFAGIILSMASSLHCVGMCGPLALAVKLNFKGNETVDIIQYHFGRLLAYLSLGVVAAFFGKGLQIIIPSQVFSITIGSLILVALLFKKYWNKALGNVEPLLKLRQFFMKKANPVLFGIGNGLIPCGLVYTALGLAILYQDFYSVLLFMMGFGLGTFPATMVIQFLGKRFNLKKYLKPGLSRVVVIVMAFLLIIRGLNLGIPYISPKIVKSELECCAKK